MNGIFEIYPLHRRSLMQKLLWQFPEENAIIELNNLLSSKQILKIEPSEIGAICKKYKLSFAKEFYRNLAEFYAAYLKYCLKDARLSDDEIGNLKHLKSILGLKEMDIRKIHDYIAVDIYEKEVREVISDGILTDKEKAFLDKLQNELFLSDRIANKLSYDLRKQSISDYLSKAIKDERLSPQEEENLLLLAKNLNIDLSSDNNTKTVLEKFKFFWLIENEDVPIIDVTVNLQKGEVCYYSSSAGWYELRSSTKRSRYGSPGSRVKIVRGLLYKAGRYLSNVIFDDDWRPVEKGVLYLTNKRIILTGQDKNTYIRMDKIESFVPYPSGVEIEKETGKNQLIRFENNADVFAVLLARILRDH